MNQILFAKDVGENFRNVLSGRNQPLTLFLIILKYSRSELIYTIKRHKRVRLFL